MKWDLLYAELIAACAEYRFALSLLEVEQEPGAMRRAIRSANVALRRCNESAEQLRQHTSEHGCAEAMHLTAGA